MIILSGTQFFENPTAFFTIPNFLDPKWHKTKLLTVEEDVDAFGNKGSFYAKGKELRIVLLVKKNE
jgi:hypothetical protein